MVTFTTVDDYISYAPSAVQAKLQAIRKVIKDTVPEATEGMSYGMPYYGHQGRLVYFAYAKNHLGLYIPPPIIEDHKEELKGYVTSKSAIQIPYDKELPVALIKKLIKARMLHNEEQTVKKKK